MGNAILLGAVAYDPKVVTIWEGIRAYFRDAGVDFEGARWNLQGSAPFAGATRGGMGAGLAGGGIVIAAGGRWRP